MQTTLRGMDKNWVGQRFVSISRKPIADWSMQDARLVRAVLASQDFVPLVDEIFMNAGWEYLSAQNPKGEAIKQSRDRAGMLRSMAGEIRQAAGKAAAKHGVSESWEAALGLEPVDAKTRAKWQNRIRRSGR
jgi:hypothetical protein